ncbi:MAG: YihY/virulence factor BrkB family protein [Chloroflexaceae bacterium]|nr:YihY/virulence factor BrkB family protein [Chloroflexaceae bacterium]
MPRFGKRVMGVFQNHVIPLGQEMLRQQQQDNLMVLSAALAYFAFFSLIPLILISLGLIGIFVGAADSPVRQMLRLITGDSPDIAINPGLEAYEQIVTFIGTFISPDVAVLLDQTLSQLHNSGLEAGLIGAIILFWSASNVFAQINQAFQRIWKTDLKQSQNTGLFASALLFIRDRALAFGLVMLSALLLLISLLANTIIAILRNIAPEILGDVVWESVSFGTAFTLLFLVLLLLFKYLPNTTVAWGDVWLGALLTTIGISLLVNLSGIFFQNSNFALYGVLGSIMVLLFWIFLSSSTLYYGAEFTYVYALLYGSRRSIPAEMDTTDTLPDQQTEKPERIELESDASLSRSVQKEKQR